MTTLKNGICLVGPFELDVKADSKIKMLSELIEPTRHRFFLPKFEINFNQHLLSEFIEELKDTCLMIADLSFERPSVYYELAIAETMNIPCLLLAQNGTPIHQTANRQNVNFYATIDQYCDVISKKIDTL